jgi:branched-chain amino acid transport system ATP-binding protein
MAPLLRNEVREMLDGISKTGVTILLVEHNLKVAMSLAQRVYVMKKGCVAFAGTVTELAVHDEVREKYLEV